jgi:FkbM family methyltransferase
MRFRDGGSGDAPQASRCAEEHPRLMGLLAEVVTAGDVFVDVGANTGFFAVPLAKIVGSAGRVLAFEPAADTAHQLRMKARAEGLLSRITIYELALGSGDGSGVLRADPGHPEDSTKRSLFISNGPAVAEVPVRSFDGLVASRAIDLSNGLHAIKVDVQGAEMHVLSGMRQSLERHPPADDHRRDDRAPSPPRGIHRVGRPRLHARSWIRGDRRTERRGATRAECGVRPGVIRGVASAR